VISDNSLNSFELRLLFSELKHICLKFFLQLELLCTKETEELKSSALSISLLLLNLSLVVRFLEKFYQWRKTSRVRGITKIRLASSKIPDTNIHASNPILNGSGKSLYWKNSSIFYSIPMISVI